MTATAPAAASPRYVDTAEGAKMIRKQLKLTFPGVKFSVRISRYAGGSSTSVSWTDGPTTDQVEQVTHGFAGARFDGMIDLAYCANSWWCSKHGSAAAETYGHSYDHGNQVINSRCCAQAELVHFGSNYVHTRRDISPEFQAELEAAVAAETGEAYDPQKWVWGGWMSNLVYRKSREISKA